MKDYPRVHRRINPIATVLTASPLISSTTLKCLQEFILSEYQRKCLQGRRETERRVPTDDELDKLLHEAWRSLKRDAKELLEVLEREQSNGPIDDQ